MNMIHRPYAIGHENLTHYGLGDESMLVTLEALGYPGPALLVMREMLPTPFDIELQTINQFLADTWHHHDWRSGSVGPENRAEFCSEKHPRADGKPHAVRYMISLDGTEIALHIGQRSYNKPFGNALGNTMNNILVWQEIGNLQWELEDMNLVQLKRFQYRLLLERCFSKGTCELCCATMVNTYDGGSICEACQSIRNPVRCMQCHQIKGKTVPTMHEYLETERTCECQVHAKCWLEAFHNCELDLERGRCELCLKSVRKGDDSEPEEEGDDDWWSSDDSEDVAEPSPKRRRLE
jgi:hypothetical protein